MFFIVAILFITIGILLLRKAGRMPGESGLRMIVGACAAANLLLGGTLIYYLLTGRIILPLC